MTLAALILALAAICALVEYFGERANFLQTPYDHDAIDLGAY
jgi:hypothetical protein